MRGIGREVATGVALIVAFIIFVFGFLFLKNVAFTTGSYLVYIKFDDVTGLEPSDQVSVSGLRVGKVEDMRFDSLRVLVSITLDGELKIPKNSKAILKSQGLVGEKFIGIIPGKASEYLAEMDTIQGSAAGEFADITGSVEGLIIQTEDLLIELKTVFNNLLDSNTQTNLKHTISNASDLSTTLAQNREEIGSTIGNVEQLSANTNDLLTANREQIDETITNIHQATTQLESFVQRIDSTLTSVSSLLSKIENQEGSVGKLVGSDEVYDDVRRLSAEVEELLEDLKKRPQKYINLKVF